MPHHLLLARLPAHSHGFRCSRRSADRRLEWVRGRRVEGGELLRRHRRLGDLPVLRREGPDRVVEQLDAVADVRFGSVAPAFEFGDDFGREFLLRRNGDRMEKQEILKEQAARIRAAFSAYSADRVSSALAVV